jgi:hypothetical protein
MRRSFPLLLALSLSLGAAPVAVFRERVEPNPTGIQFGFWANYDRQEGVLRDFGRRPIERIAFLKWAMIEKEKGVYDWGKSFFFHRKGHLFGSTVVTNVNVIATHEVNPKATQAIPAFYPGRITNPGTRAAAKRFVAAYVTELLKHTGDIILVFDYELLWNYTPKTPELRQEYRDWYVEAAEIARRTAKETAPQAKLRIMPIVNGAPLTTADRLIGGGNPPDHTPQKWLLDVVRASDYLGIDTYGYDPQNPTSAETTMRTIEFWTTNYSLGKPVLVTENGYSSVREEVPTYPRKGHHARGNEAEQAAYWQDLFARLETANQPDGPLHNQLRAFCIWMYHDRKAKRTSNPLEFHFGLRRLDGSAKPAFGVVRDAFAHLERDPFHQPSRVADSMDITADLAKGIPLIYHAGNHHDRLRATFTPGKQAKLTLTTREPAGLIAALNGTWLADPEPKTNFAMDLSAAAKPNEENTLLLWLTGPRYPATTTVRDLAIH